MQKQVRIIPIRLFSYKRNEDRSIEEHKSLSYIQGNRMKQNLHFYRYNTISLMLYRYGKRILVSHSVENEFILEHFDIHRAFLHKNYNDHKTAYIK